MSVAAYFKSPKVIRRLHAGPLGHYIDVYAERLLHEGHCYQSGGRCIRVVGDFDLWLSRKNLDVDAADESTIEQYEDFRTHHRHPFLSDHRALYRLLSLLREMDVIAPKPPATLDPLEQIEQDFENFLSQQRGLSQVSVIRHRTPLRKFLSEHCIEGKVSFSKLTSKDITHFIIRHARDQSPRSAQSMCWTIRAFTRYLLYQGLITDNLAEAVPTIRTWRFKGLPDHLTNDQIEQVLEACNQTNSIGQRDYAVLLLLARLGLRANEITTLTLDDLNWRTGVITILRKGRQRASLPLLSEVGDALATYLKHGRPHTGSRRVFVRSLAPHNGFASSAAISMIAVSALNRAGVEVRRKGTHLFRYSLATRLLQAGSSLPEIGQVLGHRAHDSTRIYAKVDINSLSKLGLPWPGDIQ